MERLLQLCVYRPIQLNGVILAPLGGFTRPDAVPSNEDVITPFASYQDDENNSAGKNLEHIFFWFSFKKCMDL